MFVVEGSDRRRRRRFDVRRVAQGDEVLGVEEVEEVLSEVASCERGVEERFFEPFDR